MTNYSLMRIQEQQFKIMLFRKSDIEQKKQHVKTAGMLATEVRSGDAPKPPFSMKTDAKSKKSGNQPQINHRKFSLFLSLVDL